MKLLIFTACLALASALPIDEKEVSHAPGGWHTIDTNTVSMLAAMHKMQVSFNMFDADSWLYHKVGKILSAESQVVSGIRYRVSFEFIPTSCNKTEVLLDELKRSACEATTKEAVQICQVTLHSQPWLDHLQSESFRCHLKPVTFAAAAVAAEGEDHPAAGGKHKIDTNDESLRKTLTQVEFQLNERLQSPNFQRIGKVLEAESQVVSGVMYHVKFQVMDTLCAKATVTKDMDLGSKCPAVVTHKQTTCTAKIWSQSWLNHLELTEVSCSTVGPAVAFASIEDEPKVPMPGGKVKIDSNDESLRKTLTQVESQLNERMNSMFIHRIGKVLEAESQVVSGVVYHVKFQLAQSKCLKSKVTKDTNLVAECPADESVHGQTCTAKIWSQPWLNHLELSDIHCEA